MIVAIVQTELHSGKRSQNMASLTASIKQAGEHIPPPDLIVLPNCCDSELILPESTPLTLAMCQGFTQTVAWNAREWGVWVAVGHMIVVGERIVMGATLFDPDGDAYVRHLHRPCDETELTDPSAVENAWTVRPTPLGVVALRLGCPAKGDLAIQTADATPVDLAIVPNVPRGSSHATDRLAELARSAKCYVCLVHPAIVNRVDHGDSSDSSVVLDRQGRIMARTRPGASGMAVAELDIPLPAAKPSIDLEGFDHIE